MFVCAFVCATGGGYLWVYYVVHKYDEVFSECVQWEGCTLCDVLFEL